MFNLFGKSKENLNAVEMLIDDHVRVKELFKAYKEIEDTSNPELIDIVTTACLELMVHSKVEEEVFYPAIEKLADEEMKKLLSEAIIEHETIDALVEKLATTELDEETYKSNFTVVMEYVEHHVQEEEDEMFPKVKALNLNLDMLATKMRARQMELVDDIAANPNIAARRSKGAPGASARV